ncbi:MAG: site-specific DNA-methyltransferase [Planctomycetes bacterium]|nr:site-specific DNA-methyltransferase [Planctomycetota bacterium]
MKQMEAGVVNLVFADPPFNIGYTYDVYKDRKAPQVYLDWSRQWISEVHRVLNPTGTFWLAIGDDYAAELKILSQELGFHCRSWVIWYYTFGVNCKFKFSRSHTHLFHFVKNPKTFTFNGREIAVPSARQTVYADGRAAAGGRLPDDTWILRPQDLTDGLNPDEDTWYFPRVAGTFKEREGFHGCQMPEQLLGRIIRVSSNPGELILDPFSGSATTVAVAKKLGRQFIAFDISDEYITRGLNRLNDIKTGDRLDGAPEPKVSAPSTPPVPKQRRRKGTIADVENNAESPSTQSEATDNESSSGKEKRTTSRSKRPKPSPRKTDSEQNRTFNFDDAME